jgi:hypothetical protein
MKVVSLSPTGLEPARLVRMYHPHCGKHWAFLHGRRDALVFPLYERTFRADTVGFGEDQEYRLFPVLQGETHMLVRGDTMNDPGFLVLWSLVPDGVQGNASYAVEGSVCFLGEGSDAEEIPCPALHVVSPCRLMWYYRSTKDELTVFDATFDGQDWTFRHSVAE